VAYRTVANGRPIDVNCDATREPIRSFLQSLITITPYAWHLLSGARRVNGAQRPVVVDVFRSWDRNVRARRKIRARHDLTEKFRGLYANQAKS
jgi:hypothetical protein